MESWLTPGAKARSDLYGIDASHDGRTKQGMRDDTDVNVIMATYGRTGQWAAVNPKTPTYGDFSEACSLEEALLRVAAANEEFSQLPAAVRELAGNDPVTFLNMLADQDATNALVAAGLPINPPKDGAQSGGKEGQE